ncbi:MAG: hypothetical protein Kow0029_08400 [Candidatus Rifleibacteriota bacterium]
MGLFERTGRFFFEWRDKLPIPLVLALPACARPRFFNWLIGLPFVLTGELLRVWSLMHIGPATRTREICADKLITSGPYCCCRNPIYLANLLKITGFICISGNLPYAITVMVFYLVEFCCIIPYEESYLAGKFPDEFERYKRLVPAVIPYKGKSAELNAPATFSLSDALRSERKTFLSTAAILVILAACSILGKEKSA